MRTTKSGTGRPSASGMPAARMGHPCASARWIRLAFVTRCEKRLTDSFPEVRNEAVWGLALRKDPAGLKLLLEHLSSEERDTGDEMTAAEILGLDYDAPVEALRTGLRNLVGCMDHSTSSDRK